MKSFFVRHVSHEIRTRLTIVLMGINLLKQDFGHRLNNDTEFLSALDDIGSSCETAIETLNELLDYEKLESGIMTLDKAKLSPWPIIRDSVKPFMIQVRSHFWCQAKAVNANMLSTVSSSEGSQAYYFG